MIPSEGLVVHEVGRISAGVLDSDTKRKRREYFRQVRVEARAQDENAKARGAAARDLRSVC